ncbi:MAG: tetratricopeptide repeat protein [Kofleriaceae bacterium]|nr:tetratricopeptide repeat protein [Kofleriaceae bacterium]
MKAALALVLLAACGSDDVVRPPHVTPARLPRVPGELAPSLVEIDRTFAGAGEVSDGAMLSDVDSCASCHPDAAAQWATSPHSFASFGNPIYRVNVELARAELGRPASLHCGGCHDMPLAVDGLMAGDVPADDLRSHSGVTCRLCHGIERVDKDGNGSYTWSRAPLDAPTLGDAASIAKHRAEVSVKSLGTELCVGCHRGFLSPDMGQGMPVHLSGLDEPGAWRNSAWTGNGIGRVDQVEPKTCIDCHMEREVATAGEVSAKDGTLASHRFLGGHTWMAAMRGDAEHLRRLQAKLEGVASIDVMPAPVAAPAGHTTFDIVVRNLLVGHRFPGGVLDIQDTWIEVEVRGARGRTLATSGLDHATNAADTETHVLRTLVVDERGNVLEQHEMPRFRTQIATQTLAPREAQAIRYDLPLAPDGPLTITARLRHRSRTLAMQDEVCRAAKTAEGRAFLAGAEGARYAELDPCRAQPITLVAHTQVVLGAPASFTRLYEHGMALTSVVSERLDEARTVLDRALAAAPDDRSRAMALVQLAQVAAKQGRADDALALVARARALLPPPGPPVLEAIEADALARVWRWNEALMPARTVATKAKQNSQTWVLAARCFGSVADNEAALAAATAGLALSPRDPDLLRSQATALAALRRPEAAAALAAYDRFRSPDNAAELRISCAADSPRCEREREQAHTHSLQLVRSSNPSG